jgi:hypothetical protein
MWYEKEELKFKARRIAEKVSTIRKLCDLLVEAIDQDDEKAVLIYSNIIRVYIKGVRDANEQISSMLSKKLTKGGGR